MVEDAILYDQPLTTWISGTNDAGWFEAHNDALTIGVNTSNGRHWNGSWTENSSFDNVSVAVDIQASNETVSSAACVVARHTAYPSSGMRWEGYELCISNDGSVWVLYRYFALDGTWMEDEILGSDESKPLRSTTEWNSLKIAVFEDSIWFLVNDGIVRNVRHSGAKVGSSGLYVINFSVEPTDFRFRNLVVRALVLE